MELAAKRDSYFDNVKSVAIFLVVIGHFAEVVLSEWQVFSSIFLFLYSFHMPLFIFITGYFAKSAINSGNKQRVYKRSFEFFTLYLIMEMTFLTVKYLLGNHSPKFDVLSEKSVPWYLFSISIMYLLAFALRNVNPKAVLALSVLIALFSGYDANLGDWLVLSRTLVFFPFFYLGLICQKDLFANLKKYKINYLLAIIVLVGIFLCFYLFPKELYLIRPLLTGRNSYFTLNNKLEPYAVLLRILVYLVGIVLSVAVLILVPRLNLKYLTTIGERTLPIYFFHRQILYILTGTGVPLYLENISGPLFAKIFWMLLAILLTLVLSLNIFNKPFAWYRKILFKPESKK